MVERSATSEYRLVELKARVADLHSAKQQLAGFKARHVGTFRQIDTYFNVPKGRLKLREIEDRKGGELIYYERKDTSGPKESDVFILRIRKPATLKALLEKVLGKKITVDKKREIYRFEGTQIHLDKVKRLGSFVEFERRVQGSLQDLRREKQVLEELMKKLGINKENLVKESYSDLLAGGKMHK